MAWLETIASTPARAICDASCTSAGIGPADRVDEFVARGAPVVLDRAGRHADERTSPVVEYEKIAMLWILVDRRQALGEEGTKMPSQLVLELILGASGGQPIGLDRRSDA